MIERFPTDILAELRVTTPLHEQHAAAMNRYDAAATELTRISADPTVPQEVRDAAIAEHHAAEIEALDLAFKIEGVAA